MKSCKHPTCEGFCRREPKPKKVYIIPKVSKSRIPINRQYTALSKQFRSDHPLCEIRSPECTGKTQGVHHTKGRGKDHLLDINTWMAACNRCNTWIEVHDKEARDKGFKLSKF